jgi:hypothetical protein
MTTTDPWAKIGASIRAACECAEDAPASREGEGWEGSIGGFCPVQGEGTVDGRFWYFRARHDDWSFEVFSVGWAPDEGLPGDDKIVWSAEAEYEGEQPNAGWMKFSEAWDIIENCIAIGRKTGWAMPSPSTESK